MHLPTDLGIRILDLVGLARLAIHLSVVVPDLRFLQVGSNLGLTAIPCAAEALEARVRKVMLAEEPQTP